MPILLELSWKFFIYATDALIPFQMVMKEKPRKRPRDPPNSASQDSNEYTRDSTLTKVFWDTDQRQKAKEFSGDFIALTPLYSFRFVLTKLYSL